MLFTHGGGWSSGDVNKIVKPAFIGTLRKLLDSGVMCAAFQYRLTREESTAVECVEDCKDAAKWNLDPDRFGVWGGSAGGHLALMTALANDDLFPGSQDLKTVTPRFRCVVSYYPLTSFVRGGTLGGLELRGTGEAHSHAQRFGQGPSRASSEAESANLSFRRNASHPSHPWEPRQDPSSFAIRVLFERVPQGQQSCFASRRKRRGP